MLKIPNTLRPVAHLIKIANEHHSRDIVIFYWCLYRAMQEGMKLDKSSSEALNFLTSILSQLEEIKNSNSEIAAIKQEDLAQTHIKNQAQILLNYAESQEKLGNFNMKVIKAFYTSGYLFDVLNVFRESDENLQSVIKYCKWRATYIHNCLKTGEKVILNNQTNNEVSNLNLNKITDGIENYNLRDQIETNNQLQNLKTDLSTDLLNNLPFDKTFKDERNFREKNKQSYEKETMFSDNLLQPHTYQCATKPNSNNLQPEDFVEARKFTKYALSALDYDDVTSAIENMHKALAILQKN